MFSLPELRLLHRIELLGFSISLSWEEVAQVPSYSRDTWFSLLDKQAVFLTHICSMYTYCPLPLEMWLYNVGEDGVRTTGSSIATATPASTGLRKAIFRAIFMAHLLTQ